MTRRSKNPQDRSDDHQHATDGPQEADAGNKSDEQQDESENNQRHHIPSLDVSSLAVGSRQAGDNCARVFNTRTRTP